MNERSMILSGRTNIRNLTVVMPKSIFIRAFEFFGEKFDAFANFVSKWTNI
jgi:hypothetical protein